MKMLAFHSKEPYVWADNRWIASLSDGSTVFEDKTPNMDSCWIRLKSYLQENRLKLTNLRLEVYGQNIILKSIKEDTEIKGYWYSNRIEMLFGSSFGGESISRGIGYIKNQVIHATWVREDGTIKEEEIPLFISRELDKGLIKTQINLGAILNVL